MKVADFYDIPVTVTVEHRGRTFEVEAYPERSTRALAEEAEKIAEEQSDAASEWHILKTLVASWTLDDEFSEASALGMSSGLRMAIIRAVNREAAFPTRAASAESSQPSSSQEESKASAQAGT